MTFPQAGRGETGYDPDEVDEFLELARQAFNTPAGRPAPLTAEEIRATAFTLDKYGYSAPAVDAALARLEDAFATRERDLAVAAKGQGEWFQGARSSAQVLLDRAVRPNGQRFRRVGLLTPGYSVRHVDAFADRIADYFQYGSPLTIDEVRSVAFPAQRRGYQEAQVDAVLDAVVSVMLAVK